jgi:hypothetical protein
MTTLGLRLPLVSLAALLGCACSGAAPVEAASDEGNARVARVQSAMVQPTGAVSPSNVRALAADWQAFERAAAAFDALRSVEASTVQGCLTVATESGAGPDESAEPAGGDGGLVPQAGSYDLACVTGGKVRGRLSFQLEPASAAPESPDGGRPQQLEIQLQDACVGGACATADVFASIAPEAPLGCAPSVTLAATATVSVAGASRTFSFGAEGGLGRSALAGVVVYFDDQGRSLTVQSGDGAAPRGPVLVSGGGQSFECTLAAAGGRCDGATSFTY